MTHKLSFLLMGAPRSGTTAVTQAINCHPRAFCGMEAFLATNSHKNIMFPKSFDQQLSHISGARHELLKQLLEPKSKTASIVGNKEPRYDLILRELILQSPHLKLIFIYRNPREFVSSWNRRAADPSDDSWHPGQRGLFGVLSLFSYLSGLQQIRSDCLIVPYNVFSTDVAGTTVGMLRYLGIDDGISLLDRPAIAQLQMVADSLRNRPREVLCNESEYFNAVALQELDTIFDRNSIFPFSEIRKKIHDYIHSIRGYWGQGFLEALAGYDDPNAVVWFRKMLRQRPIAEMFAEEAALSNQLRQYLRALPQRMKLRRIFLRRNDLKPFESFIHHVQATSAP